MVVGMVAGRGEKSLFGFLGSELPLRRGKEEKKKLRRQEMG